MRRIFRLCWLILIVAAAISRPAAQAQAPVLSFPRDHRMHQDDPAMNGQYMEWLYFTGILQDTATGSTWGYQITLWQALIPRFSEDLPLFAYDVALNEVQTRRHIAYRVTPVLLSPERFGEIRHEGDTWSYEDPGKLLIRHQETADVWHLEFSGDPTGNNAGQPPVRISADLVNDRGAYFAHTADGLVTLGECPSNRATLDGYSYYYSNPALTTTATFSVDGQPLTLSGATWFDHQWGNFNRCLMSWNWFSLRLDDGRYLMVSQSATLAGDPVPGELIVSVMDPARGTQQSWIGDEAATLTPVRVWTDPATHYNFPLAWEIVTPVGAFGIEPAFDEQMMPPLPLPYWEGIIVVREGDLSGRVIGDGFLEIAR
jgi:predicted secreted hydrolase